jgi:hypothetical protein
MRGRFFDQGGMFSYIQPDRRIPTNHPLREVRELVREVLKELSHTFGKLYSHEGPPSIPPEQLLSALLLQVFYSIRSERQLMEQLDYNLLFPGSLAWRRTGGRDRCSQKFWHLTARVKSPFVRDGNNSRSRCQRFKSFVCESMADSLIVPEPPFALAVVPRGWARGLCVRTRRSLERQGGKPGLQSLH